MANDNPRLEATSKVSQVRLNYDPENPEAGGQFLPTIFMKTKVIRTGRKNSDGTPIYTTEVIRVDNAKGDNPVVIATSSSETGFRDNRGNENYDNRLKPTANATATEKANLDLAIRDAQRDQVTSVEPSVSTSKADSRELFKVGGSGSQTENPQPPEDQSTPYIPNPTPVPVDINPGNAGGFEDFKYPLDLDINSQDSLLISIFARKPRTFQGGVQSQINAAAERKSGGRIDISKRLAAILLPIQGGINDSLKVNYDKNEMNFLQGIALQGAMEAVSGLNDEDKAAGKSVIEGFRSQLNTNREQMQAMAGAVAASAALGNLKGNQSPNTLGSRFNGQILNPNLELLFTGPNLREFSFQYLLTPRSPAEARQVIGIIKTFKQNMLPRTSSSAGADKQNTDSFFLKTPNIFRLEYQNNGSPHPFLNKFKDCALQACNVEYTPQGTYATFPDGVMHAYRLTLQFTELDPVYAEDYDEGSGSTSFSGLNYSIQGESGRQASGLGF
tara:strand:- start:243 stop:1745 length:1503 start_codon:yes stop_codon:yes gene_type:complete